MDHHEFIESGVIGNPLRATAEKGEEALRRYSDHVARGILELMKVLLLENYILHKVL